MTFEYLRVIVVVYTSALLPLLLVPLLYNAGVYRPGYPVLTWAVSCSALWAGRFGLPMGCGPEILSIYEEARC